MSFRFARWGSLLELLSSPVPRAHETVLLRVHPSICSAGDPDSNENSLAHSQGTAWALTAQEPLCFMFSLLCVVVPWTWLWEHPFKACHEQWLSFESYIKAPTGAHDWGLSVLYSSLCSVKAPCPESKAHIGWCAENSWPSARTAHCIDPAIYANFSFFSFLLIETFLKISMILWIMNLSWNIYFSECSLL